LATSAGRSSNSEVINRDRRRSSLAASAAGALPGVAMTATREPEGDRTGPPAGGTRPSRFGPRRNRRPW
jgi:hypothetical protein